MKRTARAAMAILWLSGCSSGGARPPGRDQGAADLSAPGADDGGSGPDAGGRDAGLPVDGAGSGDLRPAGDLSIGPDLSPFSGVITVKIFASNTCKITTDPPAINVPRGSTFTVDWTNLASSSYDVDVSKRDMYNEVPIVLGLEIGNHYHDTIRQWCGMFTGTFWFPISTACDTYEIPVNCSSP